MNIAAKGSAKVAITDRHGKAISGFDSGDCEPIKADSVRQTVTWGGNADVSSLAGKVVRLKFEMQNTKLYAFKFE